MKWSGWVVGGLCLALCLQPSQAFSSTLPAPYSLDLSWDPSPSPEVVGFHLYYGAVSGVYTNITALGNVTELTVAGLLSGVTYYFALLAVGADGQESDFSNEVSYQQEMPGTEMQISGLAGGLFKLTVTGTVGQTYDLEATSDLLVWLVIGTGTIGADGSLDFTDPNAAHFPQRFYRARATQP